MTFFELAEYFQKLEHTPSRNEMTEILAELFRTARQDEIGKICYLLLGRVAPLYDAIEFGIADKFMIRAIAEAYGVDVPKVIEQFKKLGDLGKVAEYFSSNDVRGKKYTVIDIFEKLHMLTQIGGEGSQERKIALLADLLRSVDALSVRYLARIPLDKLRLGFSDMTILDSLSWMASGDKSLRITLEDAYNVRPDIGFIAETVKARGMAGLLRVHVKVGAPILASLCQRLPTAREMIEKMGTVAVEPKYDGARIQIHYQSPKNNHQSPNIKTFSRNLENTTTMFSEVQDIGVQLHADEVILDGEAVGIDAKTGKPTSFQETMTRKRKHNIAQTREGMPLKFFIFDIMYKDGQELLSTPLSIRREILEKTIKSGKILVISPRIVTDSPDEIRAYHDKQIKDGLEGVVVKKTESPYEPGRRGFSWVKFKEEEGKTGKLTDTIDAVVMGYYVGEGKRTGFGIGAFLVGVLKGEQFVSLTKIGTGVSDDLWKELKTVFSRQSSAVRPKEYGGVEKVYIPDVWIHPSIVVEIAGDDLTKSPSHGAGFAVRFPRLVRIRNDKGPGQATTVAEITRMFEAQKSTHAR